MILVIPNHLQEYMRYNKTIYIKIFYEIFQQEIIYLRTRHQE